MSRSSDKPKRLRSSMQNLTLFILGLSAASAVAGSDLKGITDQPRAEYNWVMNCQGCHRANATGSQGGAPDMAGLVSQFLRLDGGRAYLVRVPGVAFAPLSDTDVAELLNWLLQTFDAEHIPIDFEPYSAKEVKIYREKPLISGANNYRDKLIETLSKDSEK